MQTVTVNGARLVPDWTNVLGSQDAQGVPSESDLRRAFKSPSIISRATMPAGSILQEHFAFAAVIPARQDGATASAPAIPMWVATTPDGRGFVSTEQDIINAFSANHLPDDAYYWPGGKLEIGYEAVTGQAIARKPGG